MKMNKNLDSVNSRSVLSGDPETVTVNVVRGAFRLGSLT